MTEERKVIEVAPISTEIAKSEEEEAFVMLETAQALVIKTEKDYHIQAENLSIIKGFSKDLENKRKTITGPMDQAKKAVMDLFRPASEALKKAENVTKKALAEYAAVQEAKRREEARKAAEKARREEAAQKAKLEEKARREAEKAEKLRSEGKEARAELAEEKAADMVAKAETVYVEPKPVAVEVPKAKGVSYREVWRAEVLRPSDVPREFLMVDEKKLAGYAKAMKSEARVAGVHFYPEKVVAGRGK